MCVMGGGSPVFVWIAFCIIHGSVRVTKSRNTYHVNDVRGMRSGRRGRYPHSNNVLVFILECSIVNFQWSGLSTCECMSTTKTTYTAGNGGSERAFSNHYK